MESALSGMRAALTEMASGSGGQGSEGKGDPRIGRCESVCLLTNALHDSEIVKADGGERWVPEVVPVPGIAQKSEVALMYKGSSKPGGKQKKPKPTTMRATAFLDESASKADVFEASGKKALEWITAGYNVNIIATGHAGSGKSSTLFGQSGRHGQLHMILNEVRRRQILFFFHFCFNALFLPHALPTS